MHGSKDSLLGIVLIGTPATQNKLHDKNGAGYLNITVHRELETIELDLLKHVEAIKAEKTSKSDWIDGLLVACDMITETCAKRKYTKRIFLITDGESKLTGADDLPLIIQGLNQNEIRVNTITLDFCNDLIIEDEEEGKEIQHFHET